MAFSVGLALSGGGFRAAAFHLGVLKRLEEVGLLGRIERLSTVSGGSMTGGLYALRCAERGDGSPGSYPVDALVAEVRPVVESHFRGRALFGTPARAVQTAASFLTRYVSRVPLLSDALDRELFGGAALADVPPWLLVNATNLMTGKSWKFFHDRAGDYLIGATDQTDAVRLSDAVAASAAYPGLADPLPFRTRWEDLRFDLLDDRWERPSGDSRWRRAHGRPTGVLTVPLADGGLYDNEGLNGLRSSRTTHAVYASTAAPEATYEGLRGPGSLLRTVDVIHSRLGAVTRQHAHEMTHGANPATVRARLLQLAERAEASADPEFRSVADELRGLAAVGWPPRGPQYVASAPVLLHRTDLATNEFATADPPVDVAPEHRGLEVGLADALSRVRTDLDAYDPVVVDLLIAQAYYLTDLHVRLAMPEMVAGVGVPDWDWAAGVVASANANLAATGALIARESPRQLLGRHRTGGEAGRPGRS